jgi:hypothetical protein
VLLVVVVSRVRAVAVSAAAAVFGEGGHQVVVVQSGNEVEQGADLQGGVHRGCIKGMQMRFRI